MSNIFEPYNVELATVFKNGDDERKYNDTVKANENFINQNFQMMAIEIATLKAIIKTLT